MAESVPLPSRPGPFPGWVYLVGGGPGDPELLTLRGARLIAGCDAVVYDNLVNQAIVDLAPAHAERVYVGKRAAEHTLPQQEINALLVRLARAGKRVIRLKGGDPFIFGRGGEEMEELETAGIPFEVVPGVTAAAGIAAYAGIPLTHRDHAQACVFATGYLKDGAVELDWPLLARPDQTVVIYMGISRLGEICRRLIEHGLPPDTPAGVIHRGTTEAQRVVVADLATLAERVREADLRPPALTLVGKVVGLYPRLAWFHPQGGEGREGGESGGARACRAGAAAGEGEA